MWLFLKIRTDLQDASLSVSSLFWHFDESIVANVIWDGTCWHNANSSFTPDAIQLRRHLEICPRAYEVGFSLIRCVNKNLMSPFPGSLSPWSIHWTQQIMNTWSSWVSILWRLLWKHRLNTYATIQFFCQSSKTNCASLSFRLDMILPIFIFFLVTEFVEDLCVFDGQ